LKQYCFRIVLYLAMISSNASFRGKLFAGFASENLSDQYPERRAVAIGSAFLQIVADHAGGLATNRRSGCEDFTKSYLPRRPRRGSC
jgi:hypothetical protein